MDFDTWGQPSPKQKQVEDATFRNNLAYLNNLRTTSFADMQAKRTQTNQAVQASIKASQQEADKYWTTSDEMTQSSVLGRSWGKTKNFAGSALDAGSQMLNQGIASVYFKDAMDAKSLVSDEAREAHARFKKNPFDASAEDIALLNRRPEAERGVVYNPQSNLELINEYHEEMEGARKWLGDARKGEKGKWGTEKYNPYFSDLRDREMKTLNDAVAEKYKPQIEALEKAGDTKGALALAAKQNAEYLGNAISANAKHNDALIGEAGSLVPYLMGGMVTAVGGAGLQTMEDYVHSSRDYEKREGHIATGADAWKMGGMAALNFGANFVENATPLKALGLAKGLAPSQAVGVAKGSVGKRALSAGAGIAGATASNFAATGLQDSIQKGWGSLSSEGVNSRSFIEAGVAGGLTAGAMTAGGHAIGGAVSAVRSGTDLAKDKIEARKVTYEDTINPESPKFNPAEAVRSQMTEFSKKGATEESTANAYAKMEQAVDIAEQQFTATRDEVRQAQAQQDENIKGNQELIVEFEERLKTVTDPEQVKEFETEIAAMRQDIVKAEGIKKTAQEKLDVIHKHANDALDQFDSFTKAQRAQAGKAPTTSTIKATTDVVTGKAETTSPEVAQDAVTQMKNSPQLYSPEALRAASENVNLPLSQNERGLFRTLAQRAVELNQSKDDNLVSKEIFKGGEGFRGLEEYMGQMATAVSTGRQRTQDRLLDEIGEFEYNTTNKAQVAQEALALSKQSGEVFQIYKDQVNGQWLVNQGEVQISDSNRAKLGALDIDANHKGSVRLVGRIENDAQQIGKTREALVQMQSVLGTPSVEAEAPMAEGLPPLTLEADLQNDLDHYNDTRNDDLSLSFDDWIPPESEQTTQPKGKDSENVKKQEATPTESVKRPETKGGSNTDKPSPQRTQKVAESVAPKAQAKADTATSTQKDGESVKVAAKKAEIATEGEPQAKAPKGQGKVSTLADATPAVREAERLKDYDDQNLVLVGFEQRTASEGAVNPLVEVKDFLTSLEEMDDAEYKATLEKFTGTGLTKAQEDHFTNFGKYAQHFSRAFGDSFVRTTSKKFHKEDFLQFLAVNEDGANGIEQNVKTAMAASTFTWLSENGEHPAYNADEIVQGIFHFKNSEGNTVSQEIHEKFAYSQSLSTMASTLGKRAVQALGLRSLSNVDSRFQGRLESSLGIHMVYALEHQGVLNIEPVTVRDMATLAAGLGAYKYRDWLSQQLGQSLPIDPSKFTPEQRTAVSQIENSTKVYGKFVHLVRDDEGVPPKLVQRIVESAKAKDGDVGSGAIIGKIFSVVPERKGPSITKVKPLDAKTKIRGSVLAPPSLQRDRINKAMENPFRVRVETADPIVNMFENYQDQLFDMLDLNHSEQHLKENFHVTQRGSIKSKRQAVIRDLEHGVGFVKGQLTRDDKGEYQQVYLGMNVVRTQRMHVDNNDLNTQANQVHRSMLTPADYRAEIDVPKLAEGEQITADMLYNGQGEMTKLGRMFEAVAEHAEELGLKTPGHVGNTADKVHPDTYLPEFLAWYHSAETQSGIKATANLMALTKSGDKIPESVFRDMSKTVKAMGMGIQSFNGLVSLAEMHMAMNDPKAPSTFVTYLRAGSDGKTNGSAIALTQSGTVDASTGSNDMSDGFGLITKASANDPEKGFQNQYEVARSGMGDLYNTINTYQDNRWNQLLASTTFTSSTGDNVRLRKTADRMNVLFGDFLQRAKGKTIASPTIYGSGTSAIKINSVNEAVSAIYKKMAKIAQTGKTDPETATQQLDVMRKDLNAIFALFNNNFRSIPDGMYGKEGMETYRTQLEYDYNSRNADAPIDFSGMSDMDFLAKYTGKDGTLNSMWYSAKYRYSRERPNVAPVSLIKDGELALDSLLESELPRDLMLALETVIYNTHGRVHEMALQDAYKDYLAVRDVNIAMSSVAYETYAALKESLVEAYIQEGMEPTSEKGLPRIPFKMVDGKKVPLEGLSKKAVEEIDRELYNARPIVVSALSSKSDDPVGTGIMLTDTRTQLLKAEDSHVSVRTRSVHGNANSKSGISKSEVGISADVDGDPGVRGSVFPVLGIDAFISSAALAAGFATENMHDANYSNLDRVGELGRIQNEAFHEVTSTYHMQVEMLNMMMRSLDQVAKGNIPISDASQKKIQEALNRLADKMPVEFEDKSMSGFLKGLTEQRYALEAKKLDYLDSLDTVHQYGSWGGEVKLTETHQKVRDDSRSKLEQDLSTKALGRAKRVGNALEKLFGGEVRKGVEDEAIPLSKTERILGRGDGKPLDARVALKALRKEVVTSASGRQLLDVLEGILPDGLTINLVNDQAIPDHVDTTYQKGKSMIDAGASGWYSPKANQINILDSNSANSRVGGELLIHELLHAGLSHGIALAQSGKGTPAMREAVDRLESLRSEVEASLKGTAREAEFKEALTNVDELVSWGMTNPTFQKYLASTTVERKGRKIVSMFKDFVTSALDLVFGHDRPRSTNRKHIPAYEALIMDMASLSSEITALKGVEAELVQEAKPMIPGQERAKQRATQASPREIFRALDGQGNSREFTQRVETMMDTVIETVITRAGREHLKDGLTKVADRSVDARSAGFALNDREAYAVEAFEVVVDTALDNGAGSNVMKVMHKAYEEARKAMSPQAFHKGDWTHATAQDKAIAQAKFDYIFKVKATGGRNSAVARFASLALGSEQMSQLLNFKPGVEADKPTTTYGKLLKAFDYAVAWANNWMAGTHRSQTVTAKVDALVNRIAQIDTRSRNIAVARFSAGYDWMTAKMGSLNSLSAKAIGKLGQFELVRNSKYAWVRAVGQSARLAVSDKIDNIPNALRDLRNHENPGSRYGVVAETLNEFGSAKGFAKGLQKLLRGTKEIEKARAAVKASVKSIVEDSFNRTLTPEENKALAYGLLRTDAHSLLDTYSAQDLQGLVAQKLKRDRAIGQAQAEIMRMHPQGNAMINKAKQLAWYLQSGNPTAGLVMNAQAIAQGLGSSKFVELQNAAPKLVESLDKLASLWAIEYMDADSRKTLAQVMSQELSRKDGVNGFENVLRVHKQLSADAMEHRFKDNPLSAIKGWVPEINNPYVETRIDVVSNGEKLEAQGWVKVADLSRDPNDPIKQTQAMYTREGGYQRRVSAVMSLTDSHTKGMIITDQGMSQAVTASQAHLVKQVELTNHVTYDPRGDQNTQLFATYDTLGNVMHHSYRMNNNARDELLQRKHDVGELLGEYAGTSLDKTHSPAQNIRTIDALHADYLSNYTKNPRAYVAIGQHVADRGAQELWRLLPHDTRKAMEDTWGKNEPMYVRNDLVSLVFGYRKLALGNIWNKQQQERNFAERMYTLIMEAMFKDKAQLRSYQVGRATSEIVSTAKDFIVLRTPAVLMGNMTFNTVLLTALGVNPVNAMRDGMLAFKAGKAYQDDRKELLGVEAQLRSGVGDTAKLEQRLAVLQDSMARNPLKAFIESGTMPAIVDDVEATNDDFGYKTALASKASELTSAVPDGVKTVGKTLMMSPGTVGHNFMSAATQYSDFIGRYIAYKHFTEKEGMTHDDAVHEAMETFINYDLPSSAQVQWLNDVGGMLFTKFLFRYQRVMLALLRKNPALVMTQSMMLGAMSDLETVLDPNLLSKGLGVINPGPIILPSAVLGSGVLGVAL